MTTTSVGLDTPLPLSEAQIARFREEGFILLRDVLPGAELSRWRQIIGDAVRAHNDEQRPLAERDTYGQAFLQTINLWRVAPEVRPFVFGRRLAGIARQLIGTAGVRIYHDQALFKEPGGGHTPWHADQFYWPLASELTVTAWVPLVPVTADMGPLGFSAGSQNLRGGRGYEISDESEAAIQAMLDAAGLPLIAEPFDLGDVSFHYGWTYHRADANRTDRARDIMTMIYMDSDMRLAEPANESQRADRASWVPGIAVGEVCASALNPLVG